MSRFSGGFLVLIDYVFINLYVKICLEMVNLWHNTPQHKFLGFFFFFCKNHWRILEKNLSSSHDRYWEQCFWSNSFPLHITFKCNSFCKFNRNHHSFFFFIDTHRMSSGTTPLPCDTLSQSLEDCRILFVSLPSCVTLMKTFSVSNTTLFR